MACDSNPTQCEPIFGAQDESLASLSLAESSATHAMLPHPSHNRSTTILHSKPSPQPSFSPNLSPRLRSAFAKGADGRIILPPLATHVLEAQSSTSSSIVDGVPRSSFGTHTLPSIRTELGLPNPRAFAYPPLPSHFSVPARQTPSPSEFPPLLGTSLSLSPEAFLSAREPRSPASVVSSLSDNTSSATSNHSSPYSTPLRSPTPEQSVHMMCSRPLPPLVALRTFEPTPGHVLPRRVASRISSTSSTSLASGITEISDGETVRKVYREVPKLSRKGPPKEELHAAKPFGCGFCTHRFAVASKRDEHQSNHRYPCDFAGCGAVLTGADVLRSHKARHKDQRTHLCKLQDCGKGFNTHGDLYQHQRQTHGLVPDTSRR